MKGSLRERSTLSTRSCLPRIGPELKIVVTKTSICGDITPPSSISSSYGAQPTCSWAAHAFELTKSDHLHLKSFNDARHLACFSSSLPPFHLPSHSTVRHWRCKGLSSESVSDNLSATVGSRSAGYSSMIHSLAETSIYYFHLYHIAVHTPCLQPTYCIPVF